VPTAPWMNNAPGATVAPRAWTAIAMPAATPTRASPAAMAA
jgi:hypothetical protein